MDICCENCGEPWDHNHVLDEISGIRSGATSDNDLEHGVKDADGQWWRFWFVYRNQFYEANYRILLCPACEPDVGQDGCKECFGSGRVFIVKAPAARNPDVRCWFWGFSPHLRRHPTGPFRVAGSHSSLVGRVYRGWAYCPACFPSLEAYKQAMHDAGWTMDFRDEESRWAI